MSLKLFFISFSMFLFIACSSHEKLSVKALEIVHKYPLVDGHIDLPERLKDDFEDVSKLTLRGNFDLVRATKGGVTAPFMSIFIDAKYQMKTEGGGEKNSETAYDEANYLMQLVDSIVTKYPNQAAYATTPTDIMRNFKEGKISLLMGMENGAPIEGKLERIDEFYQRGIRYITLTHGKWNHISDSSYDLDKHWNGISPFGEQVIEKMNNTGILIDISHVSDSAFYDVMRLTKTPAIASHSSCRFYTKGFERNMGDDLILALAKNGGMIMINYASSFLTQKANDYERNQKETLKKWQADLNISSSNSRALDSLNKVFSELNPYPFATLDDVVEHFVHVKNLVGIDHIGFGSDFDGVGDSLPIGLKSVDDMPNLIDALLKKGFSESDIKKLMFENFFRVLQKNIDYSLSH